MSVFSDDIPLSILNKQKIAVVSCNIGGIDKIHAPVKQKHAYDYFYYTENNLPFPLPNLDNRMKGKYLKTQMHMFLDYDVFIWIDGSVEVVDGHFIDWCLQKLEGFDVVIEKHEERENVYQEFAYILSEMRSGSPYLNKRYAGQPFEQELKFYGDDAVKLPLYKCSFFALKNFWKTKAFLNKWWQLTLQFSNLDQCAFSYAAYTNSLNVNSDISTKDFLIRHKHE